MITRTLLRALRNDLPMPVTLQQLGSEAPYSKYDEGRFRFVCPHCGETQATVNPRNNLAHCFNCRQNINNIDLMLKIGYDFRKAVERLEEWLRLYRKGHHEKKEPSDPPRLVERAENRPASAQRIAQILRQEFENQA